jgi:uncharacterized protein (DUF1800 family)
MSSSREDIAHLLRRSGFVAPEARIAQLMALDLPDAVNAVLNTAGAPDDTPPAWLLSDSDEGYKQWVEASQWWIDRMVSTPTPIVEKMTLFWHGHFTSSWEKVHHSPAMLSQNRLYRSLALGDFRTLAQRMALEPAMLVYLDNASNVFEDSDSVPNQNFARELMELFLLGVGNYTEEDVDAAARAWTGHNTVRWDDPRYVFNANKHDTGNKTFFGTTKNWDGPDIINEILDNPVKRPIMAKFIAKKMWEFFAYQRPAQGIVDALAQVFMNSNLSILELVRALFNRPEFYSVESKQGHVRSPIEWVVAVLSGTGLKAAATNPQWYFERMGQEPFNPPNVSGWRPNAYWVNTSAFSGRAEFARNVMWTIHQAKTWEDIKNGTAAQAIDRAANAFGLQPLSGTTLNAMTQTLSPLWERTSNNKWAQDVYLLTMSMLAPELSLA